MLHGNMIIIKRWTPREEHGKTTNIHQYWAGGKMMNNTESHSWISGGLTPTAGIWTTSRRSTSPTRHIITKEAVTRIPSQWRAAIQITNQDQWLIEDYRATTKALVTLRAEQDRNPTFIPKLLRTGQRKTRPSKKFGIAQWTMENVLLRIGFVIFSVMVTKLVATRRSNLNGKTLVGRIINGMIIPGKIENGEQWVRQFFYREWRFPNKPRECAQNTSPHAHFPSFVSPCESSSCSAPVWHFFTCTARACGSSLGWSSRYDRRVLRASQQNILSTSCLSLVFRLHLLSVRRHLHPGHLLQMIGIRPTSKRMDSFGPLATRHPGTLLKAK